jgi:predicted amidophosphoribosyltransferase
MFRASALGRNLMDAALALLYPSRCAACDALVERAHDVFCAPCALTLVPIEAACPRCARPLPPSASSSPPAPCLQCLQRPPNFAAALAPYEFGGALAQAIRKLKWRHRPELARPLGILLAVAWARAPAAYRTVDVLVPVPLHPSRLRVRELNQAAALAQSMRVTCRQRARDVLEKRTLTPEAQAAVQRLVDPCPLAAVATRVLLRERDTPPQTGLSALERRRNVLGAFVVRDRRRIAGKQVLLVDDVLTTGATADACAAVLRAAGAASVLVLTLGRAMP